MYKINITELLHGNLFESHVSVLCAQCTTNNHACVFMLAANTKLVMSC